jgi:hypothetical protein
MYGHNHATVESDGLSSFSRGVGGKERTVITAPRSH